MKMVAGETPTRHYLKIFASFEKSGVCTRLAKTEDKSINARGGIGKARPIESDERLNCLRLYLCTMPPVPMPLRPMPSLLPGLPLSVG